MSPLNLDDELRRAVATGKVLLGTRSVLKEARLGKGKLVILSSNCPKEARERIMELAKLSKIPVIQHDKTGVDLGALCGKPFIVSAMIIKDPGDSKILSLVKSGDA